MSMSPIAHTGPHGPTRAQSFPGAHVKIGWGEVVPEGESSSQKFPSLFLGTTGAMASPGGMGALAVNRLMLSERDTQHPTAPPKQDKGPGARAALGPENREGGEAVSTPLTRTLPRYPGSCPAVPWRSALPVWPAPRARHPAIGLCPPLPGLWPRPPSPHQLGLSSWGSSLHTSKCHRGCVSAAHGMASAFGINVSTQKDTERHNHPNGGQVGPRSAAGPCPSCTRSQGTSLCLASRVPPD